MGMGPMSANTTLEVFAIQLAQAEALLNSLKEQVWSVEGLPAPALDKAVIAARLEIGSYSVLLAKIRAERGVAAGGPKLAVAAPTDGAA